jgi:putative ABC transport system permease protein
VLTRKKAINLFGRALSSGGGSRGWSLRQGLIGLQFAVLIGLGSLSWVAYDQLDYMLDDSLRMPTESVVLIDGAGRDSAAYQTWRRRLLSSSAVQAVGMGNGPEPLDFQTSFTLTGTDQVYQGLNLKAVDVHYFDVMGIEAPAIEEMKKQGGTAPNRLILNQTAADLLAAQDPVGKRIYRNPQDPGDGSPPIAGVVPDLQLHSMRKAVPPTAFRVYARPPWSIGILVRFAPGRLQDGMEHLRGVWSDLRPDEPFEASFLSEEVARLYEQERRFTTLSGVLAGIAVLLAALGLASLVAYLTRLRLKEIGVRKALGGSTASIVALLNKEYVQIVGVAFLVGAPLAWWAADAWLGRFASRIDLSPLVFLGSGLVALVVAVGAVSVQALRAARVDPARVLRSE